MTKKVFLSIAASMLLAGTQANAFGLSGSQSGEAMGNGGSVSYGFSQNGGYICINGFSWMGSGSMSMSGNTTDGMSFGSASGCGEEDFDFYYKTFGGFIEDTEQLSSTVMKLGKDDTYDDGFWYREGAFSAPVYYGDPENDGKRYADDPNGAWPAWTWGRPEADPFVSANGAGDDLGGAAGIGLGGFGMGDGNKIKAGDSDTFYPLNFIEVNNYKNSFYGSYASDVSWNVAIYDKDHNEVFKKNYTTTMYYWESINYQNSKYGLICPRSSVDAGETINDLAYNQAVKDNIFSGWPANGLDVDFVGDGASDETACADPVKLKDSNMTDTFSVKKFMFGPEKKYQVNFDGPYVYDATKAGCPAVNEEGLPDTAQKWPAECFEKVDTLWADEGQKTRAFMRMSITEADSDCDMNMNAGMPDMGTVCDTVKTVEQKAQDTINSMMQKANTTLEQAKKAVEDAQDCDFSNLAG